MGVVAYCLFSPAEKCRAERGDEGVVRHIQQQWLRPLIRRCAPPSPRRWGEEGGRPYTSGTSNTSPALSARKRSGATPCSINALSSAAAGSAIPSFVSWIVAK
jgi:hypothetical protein